MIQKRQQPSTQSLAASAWPEMTRRLSLREQDAIAECSTIVRELRATDATGKTHVTYAPERCGRCKRCQDDRACERVNDDLELFAMHRARRPGAPVVTLELRARSAAWADNTRVVPSETGWSPVGDDGAAIDALAALERAAVELVLDACPDVGGVRATLMIIDDAPAPAPSASLRANGVPAPMCRIGASGEVVIRLHFTLDGFAHQRARASSLAVGANGRKRLPHRQGKLVSLVYATIARAYPEPDVTALASKWRDAVARLGGSDASATMSVATTDEEIRRELAVSHRPLGYAVEKICADPSMPEAVKRAVVRRATVARRCFGARGKIQRRAHQRTAQFGAFATRNVGDTMAFLAVKPIALDPAPPPQHVDRHAVVADLVNELVLRSQSTGATRVINKAEIDGRKAYSRWGRVMFATPRKHWELSGAYWRPFPITKGPPIGHPTAGGSP